MFLLIFENNGVECFPFFQIKNFYNVLVNL